MSDFLMVVPEGWVEVPTDWIGASNDIVEVNNIMSAEAWGDLENILALVGVVPAGQHVLNARFVTLSDGYHLWVLFG